MAGTARWRLYWSNIACDGASVTAGGDGEGVEWPWSGLDTDVISSEDDAASSSGVEASAPDLVVTLTVRNMGRPDGYGSEITIVPFSEME